MKFIEYWDFFKCKFSYGIDYIDVDACDYIAICVASFDVMHELWKSGVEMYHCTVQCKQFLIEQFNNHALNKKENGIKVFYFLKNANIDDFKQKRARFERRELEFWGWIKPKSTKKILYHFCDVFNTHAKTSDDEIAQFIDYIDFGGFSRETMQRYPDMTLARMAINLSYDKIISEV